MSTGTPIDDMSAEVERQRERASAGDETAQAVLRFIARAKEVETERRALPCWPATEAGRPADAIDACAAAGARASCRWRVDSTCPWAAENAVYERAAEHLSRSGAEARERDLLLAAIPRRSADGKLLDRRALVETDALRIARALVARACVEITLSDGITVPVRGDETLVVLAGPTGCGKTLGGCYAISVEGGLYLRAADLGERDAPMDEASSIPLLVLDDLGVEFLDRADWIVGRIERILDARHGRKLRTIATTNLLRRCLRPGGAPQFAERYGARIDDRLREGGLYVGLGGPSLRGRSQP